MHTHFNHPDDLLRIAQQHNEALQKAARTEELARHVAPRRLTKFLQRPHLSHRLTTTVDTNSLTCDVPCIAGT